MSICYLHGFGSSFSPQIEKIKTLSQLDDVIGPDLDYTLPFYDVVMKATDFILKYKPILLVGTSMGGYLASHLGYRLGIPFVAINPALYPSLSLERHDLGEYTLSTYPDFYSGVNRAFGLILLDEGDEVFDSTKTQKYLSPYYEVHTFLGGSHQFDHMNEALSMINSFIEKSELSYGH